MRRPSFARRWGNWPSAGSWSSRWLWLNLAAVVLLSGLRGYGDRGSFRAYQYDLVNFTLLAREYAEAGFTMGLKNDWLNGVGGFTYHWNPLLQLDMLVGLFGRPFYDFGVSVAVLLVATFVTTYALARSLQVPRSFALQAAWIVFMFTPYRWVSLLATEPPYVMSMILTSSVIICLARVVSLRRRCDTPWAPAAWMIAATVLCAWIVVARPFAFIFILPSLVAQGLAVAWWWRRSSRLGAGSEGRGPGRPVVIGCLAVIVICLAYAVTFVPFAAFSGASLGTLDHDPNGFTATFSGVLSNLDLPAVDTSSTAAGFASLRRFVALGLIQLAPTLLIATGLVGAVVWVRRGHQPMRAYAVMAVATLGFVALFAIVSEFVNTQLLIRYALLATLPQLAVASTGVLLLVGWLWRRHRRVRPSGAAVHDAAVRQHSRLMPIVKPAALVINMVAAALLLSLFYLRVETPVVGFPNELASGRTVDMLVRAAAWQQGSPFRGRVLAVRHADQAAPLTTEVLSDPWINDEDLDWTLLALKEHQVPTLAPYGQLISPGLLRVSRDLFGVAGDEMRRNEIVTRRLTLESARLFGVRFVIADAPLRIPGTTELVKLSGSPDLYVYEITDANVAGLSPTNVITSADWRGTLAAMTAPDFVADRDVVVDVDAAEDLVDLQPVSSSSIMLSGYDITVSAETRGRSLLVLPFEFSHCLDASASDGGFVRLQPVNGILTGVVFEGSGTVRITALGAPWSRAACRLHDRSWWRDMFGPKLLAGQSTYVAAVKP